MLPAMSRPFLKMNGLGNDFVVVEARSAPFRPAPAQARAIADLGRTVSAATSSSASKPPGHQADAFMRIWNADGGEVDACGNVPLRCVGWLLMQASGRDEARIETAAGLLVATRADDGQITVDMGVPGLKWTDIPLAEEMDTKNVELQIGARSTPPILHTLSSGCVSMGEIRHVVFFVPDVASAPVREVGPMIEHHHLFPERANVGFAQIEARDRIALRVWERGAGETRACGTGACAALVAAARRNLTDRKAVVALAGGELIIEWRESDGHVLMTGPVAVEFTGNLP